MACEGRALPREKHLTGILETDGGWVLGSFGDKLNWGGSAGGGSVWKRGQIYPGGNSQTSEERCHLCGVQAG